MFVSNDPPPPTRLERRVRALVCVARERGPAYQVVPPRPDATAALAALDTAVSALAAVDWASESDETVNAAALRLQRQVNQVSAQSLRPLTAMQRRATYVHDGAASAASWLGNRSNQDPHVAQRVCTAARRLDSLAQLRDAFRAGEVSLHHVTAITEAAVPARFDAIASVEDTLVELARTAKPRALRTALHKIRDIVDPDGSDVSGDEEPIEPDEHDPRRFWHQRRTIEGLTQGEYCIDGAFGEMLTILFDAFSTPDPADTPLSRRRSPAHKRADAMRAAVLKLLNAGLAPSLNGNKAHMLLMLDLLTIMGRDQAATFASELRRTGRVSPATVAKLGLDARVTPVLTMGPWRVVAVGRTHRTLPPWLRPMLEMLHRRCRGPDCDRPACWTQAHHQEAYAAGGDTDLNKTIPLCQAHHNLVTHGGWTVDLDLDTGICTWTGPTGQVIHTYPQR